MTQRISFYYNAPLISNTVNERFGDFFGGSVLSGGSFTVGSLPLSINIACTANEPTLVITNNGARVLEDETILNAVTFTSNNTAQDRYDGVYMYYRHGDPVEPANYVAVAGIVDSNGIPYQTLDPAFFTFLGYVRIPANNGSIAIADLHPVSNGFAKGEFAGDLIAKSEAVFQGTAIFEQHAEFNGSATFNDAVTFEENPTFSSPLNINVDAQFNGNTTFQGSVTANSPTQSNEVATKAYVDAVKTGLLIKDAVRVATTANLTLSGAQTIDDVSVVVGDRVLVKAQTDAAENGIYVASSGAWSRAVDMDDPAEIRSGLFCFVSEGTLFKDTGWVLTTNDPISIGSTVLSFTQFSGSGSLSVGDGLSQNGTQLSIAPATSTTLGGVKQNNGLQVTADGSLSLNLGDGLQYDTGTSPNKRATLRVGDGLTWSGTSPTKTVNVNFPSSGGDNGTTIIASRSDHIHDARYYTKTQVDTAFTTNATQAGTGLTKTGTTLSISDTAVTPGTYKSVTVNQQGQVTAGSNPTTLSGYGITDAVSSSDVVTTATANKILKLNASAKLPADITGNAATATTASSVAFSGITGKPTTLSGYGITDAVNVSEVVTIAEPSKLLKLDENGDLPANITGNAASASSVPFSGITGKPTTLAGYGIVDAVNKSGDTMTGFLTLPTDPTSALHAATKQYADAVAANTLTAGTGITKTGTVFSITSTGVTAGTYKSVTVNAQGQVTSGTNPTTLSGYGITDAVASSDVVTTATANKILKLDANAKLPADITGNAATATKWATGRTVALTGDVTGTSVAFDGSANLSFATTLANSGATAGTYKSVTVDAKGRVTAGTNPTTLTGYGITDAVSSSDVVTTATANKILKLDSNALLPTGITGNAATATTLATGRTISVTGDATGTSAAFNGSANASIAITLADSGATAGTYKSVTVDAKGRVTSGTNPTTLSGYGITDALTASSTLNANNLTTGTVPLSALSIPISNNLLRSNLGSPSLFEVGLIESETTNKLMFKLPLSIEYSTDGTTWQTQGLDLNSTAIKNMVIGRGSGSGFTITNGWYGSRVTFRKDSGDFSGGYVYLNQFYSYCSTSGHTMKIIVEQSYDGTSWSTLSNTNSVSTWPGHIFLSHATIPWNVSPTLGTHYRFVRVTFVPTWNATYPSNNVSISRIDWYGGYPAQDRQVFSWDFDKNFTFPAQIAVASDPTSALQVATKQYVDAAASGAAASITAGTGLTKSGNTISITDTAITPGTYRSVTINQQGQVTAGTNPTTLSGYGITDAIASADVVTTATANKVLKLDSSALLPTGITGNAATATKWLTGRTVALTGDVTGTSATFDGSANLSFATTLANSGATAGTYKSVTIDAKGRVTGGTNPTTLSGYGITDAPNNYRWSSVIKGQTWSRILELTGGSTVGHSIILNVVGTRGNVVYNTNFIINASHNSKASIIQMGGSPYANGAITFKIRAIIDDSGNGYIELFDDAYSIAIGVDQPITVSCVMLRNTSINTFTTFTDGTTIPITHTNAKEIRTVNGSTIVGDLSGNATTATKWETGRTVALTGDVTGTSTAFDGSGNLSFATTLANSGVTIGTYRSVTVDAKGRVTSGTNPTTLSGYGITDALSLSGGTLTGALTLPADPTLALQAATKQYVDSVASTATSNATSAITAGTGLTKTSNTLSITNTGVTAGTYKSVTVNAQGQVTAGTNPTTLSGYGITDAVASSDVVTTATANKILKLDGSALLPTGITGNAATATKWATGRTVALTGDVTGTSAAFDGSGNLSFATTLASSGVTIGTYKSVTVDAKGRVTSGTNPTTLSGYGITDALSLSGGTLTGALTLPADPSSALHAATKQYVDGLIQGLDFKGSVRVATTANITLSGTQTIDGVAVIAGDRVLVKQQTTGSQNGIYVVASGAWTRSTDAENSAEVTPGMYVFVEEGTENGDSAWVLTNTAPVTLGTTALTFSQFSGAGQVVAGTGLSKSANTLSIANTGVTASTYRSVTVNAQGQVTAGTNPTTLSGYGITDAVASTDVVTTATANKILKLDASALLPTGITGNAATATTLATGRTIALTGDATGTSAAFNGSANASIAVTLANSGATAGTYKSVTVDAKGRVTAGTNPTTLSGYGITDALPLGGGTLTGALTLNANPTTALHAATKQYVDNAVSGASTTLTAGTGISVSGTTISIANTTVTAGTYKSVTVNAQGQVTAGTNPTTLSGYGITDAVASSDVATTAAANKILKLDASALLPTGITGNAATATKWATGRTVALTGDVTGTSAAFDGSGNLSFATTLANSGVTIGTYRSVTVDIKGRVTGGTNPTTLSGYGITDAVASSDVVTTATANKILKLDANALLPTGITGNAATATTLATGRTIALTGDATGTSAAFNGSANASIAVTLANSGVTAGTYKSVTVDAKGRVTSGTNPTTISGYGITDAVSTTLLDDLAVMMWMNAV